MSEDIVYLYRDGQKERAVTRADVCRDGVWFCGLRLLGGDAAHCSGVELPPEGTVEALCANLENSRMLWNICAEMYSCLCSYLRIQKLTLFWGRAEVQRRSTTDRDKIWFRLHPTKDSGFADKKNYLCNAILPDRKELCGIRLVWLSEDCISISFPTPDSLRQADALLRDPECRKAVCAMIRAAAQPTRVAAPSNAAAAQPQVPSQKTEPPQIRGRMCNRVGRIKDANASNLMKYTPGNVLRPAGMVDVLNRGWGRYEPPKADVGACANALGSGYIDTRDIELLSALAEFRFLTNAMTLDLYSCERIPCGGSFVGSDKLNKQMDKLCRLGLITPCRLISMDENGKPVPGRTSTSKIYVLSSLGASLLQELGREARAATFDAFQDGAVVRENLCMNQWLLYWLTAFPEAISGRVVRDRIVYGFGSKLSGAWLGAWLTVGGRMLAALPLRRCAETELATLQQDIEEKAARLNRLFEAPDRLCSFSGDAYQTMNLSEAPILNYICEDEAHALETAELLRPYVTEKQPVWITWDQRLFNYEFEGARFLPLTADGLGDWLDPGGFLGIGEERKDEKRLDRENPLTEDSGGINQDGGES